MNERMERARRARLMDDLFVRQCAVKSEELAMRADDPDRERLARVCRQLTALQDTLGYLPLGQSLPKAVYEAALTQPSRLGSVIRQALKRR